MRKRAIALCFDAAAIYETQLTLKLHGAWAHGWWLDLGVMDEPTKHDPACIMEIISRRLERVQVLAKQRGVPAPQST